MFFHCRPINSVVLFLFTLLVLITTASTAQAQISVSKSVLEFNEENLIQDLDVTNTGDFKIFLNLSVAQIRNPHTANPERVELTDPRTSPVLVSPKQLLIPPGQRKRVRVILRKLPKKVDHVYRLAIKPFTGDVQLDTDRPANTKASAIKILLGYDILLLARPKDAVGKLAVKRTADKLYFKNMGNTNVLLRRMRQCNSNGRDCVDLTPNRVYAGELYKVDLPKKGSARKYPVQVWQATGLKNSKKTY
ncbi:MAG: molecular chaperone [Granulosicoccus sp.]